jgi:hypothetical protein
VLEEALEADAVQLTRSLQSSQERLRNGSRRAAPRDTRASRSPAAGSWPTPQPRNLPGTLSDARYDRLLSR